MKPGFLTMSAAIVALAAGGAMAQTTATDGMTTEPPAATDGMAAEPAAPAFTSIEEMTVGDVIGMVAYDPDGNKIAEIDYVIDRGEGGEAVLGIGGFLGLGEYTVALPLEDFELGGDGTFFTLSTDKETLKAEPEIDESTIESLPDDTPIAQLIEVDDGGAVEEAPATEEPADTMEEEPATEEPADTMEEEPATEEPADTVEEQPAAEEPADTVEEEPVEDTEESPETAQ